MIAQQSRNDSIGTPFYDAKRLSENPMGYRCYFRLLIGSLEVVHCIQDLRRDRVRHRIQGRKSLSGAQGAQNPRNKSGDFVPPEADNLLSKYNNDVL